jgi:hypothetical protein
MMAVLREQPEDLIKAYKAILARTIDKRPSGTRQRLADALGKHRSFITQITGVAYPTPLPERHIATIFSVCHFSDEERRVFLAAYHAAHPERGQGEGAALAMRHVSFMARDFGDAEKNRRFDEAIADFAQKMAALVAEGRD